MLTLSTSYRVQGFSSFAPASPFHRIVIVQLQTSWSRRGFSAPARFRVQNTEIYTVSYVHTKDQEYASQWMSLGYTAARNSSNELYITVLGLRLYEHLVLRARLLFAGVGD